MIKYFRKSSTKEPFFTATKVDNTNMLLIIVFLKTMISSRKGNTLDNGMMESFFEILKSQMFYGLEKTFSSIEELESAIVEDIDYYNKRIKAKLQGLSPVQYRTQSFV